MERVEVIRAGIGMCQVIRQNLSQKLLGEGCLPLLCSCRVLEGEKRDRSEIRVYCTARVVVLIFVFSFLL